MPCVRTSLDLQFSAGAVGADNNGGSTMSQYKLSPSDLTFLWDECPRCFYLKVARNFSRPSVPFPGIFSAIDARMTAHYNGMRTERIAPAMPPGVISHSQRWVHSQPLAVPGSASTCYVRGRFDTTVALDDGTYGVIDFKTSTPKAEHAAFYGRQLHAYALALERPAGKGFALAPVTALGLIVFQPTSYVQTEHGAAQLGGSVSWLPVARDDEVFMGFLSQVVRLLDGPEAPPAGDGCVWCRYRVASRESAH